MNTQMSGAPEAVWHAKVYLVPALIIGCWLALLGGVVTAMGNPLSLHASIESVLETRSGGGTPGPAAYR